MIVIRRLNTHLTSIETLNMAAPSIRKKYIYALRPLINQKTLKKRNM